MICDNCGKPIGLVHHCARETNRAIVAVIVGALVIFGSITAALAEHQPRIDNPKVGDKINYGATACVSPIEVNRLIDAYEQDGWAGYLSLVLTYATQDTPLCRTMPRLVLIMDVVNTRRIQDPESDTGLVIKVVKMRVVEDLGDGKYIYTAIIWDTFDAV